MRFIQSIYLAQKTSLIPLNMFCNIRCGVGRHRADRRQFPISSFERSVPPVASGTGDWLIMNHRRVQRFLRRAAHTFSQYPEGEIEGVDSLERQLWEVMIRVEIVLPCKFCTALRLARGIAEEMRVCFRYTDHKSIGLFDAIAVPMPWLHMFTIKGSAGNQAAFCLNAAGFWSIGYIYSLSYCVRLIEQYLTTKCVGFR